MTRLRWGLLGTARINRSLIPPLRLSDRNEPVAVASRTRDRAEAFAEAWGLEKAYGSYEALLADPEIDVVYLPLPNHLHVPWTMRAVAAGKHVLCEKPLALTPGDVDRVARAAEEAGVVVMEAFMYRHHPRTQKARELVEAGALGELRLVRGAFTFVLDRPDDIRWRPEWGGGSLWDVGCYPVSFTRYVLGSEPTEVFGQQVTGPSGVDVAFAGQLRFPGDVLALFDCGFKARFRMEMSLVGEEGVLEAPYAFKPRPGHPMQLYRAGSDSPEPVPVADPEDLYLGEVEALADAILLGHAPAVTLAESRANTAVLTALLASARAGKPVRIG